MERSNAWNNDLEVVEHPTQKLSQAITHEVCSAEQGKRELEHMAYELSIKIMNETKQLKPNQHA